MLVFLKENTLTNVFYLELLVNLDDQEFNHTHTYIHALRSLWSSIIICYLYIELIESFYAQTIIYKMPKTQR